MNRICVFCGSNFGVRDEYRQAARALGGELVRRNLALVYGGGNVGLMGVIADTVLEAGGAAIGVIPAHLVAKEVAHKNLTELRVVETMHERKALMAELADAFIALPGGYGTFEEFCEILTWAQLGLHRKPCGILNTAGFYDPLLALFDHATAEGFVRRDHRAMLLVETDPAVLLDRLATYNVPIVEKWLTPEEV